MAHENDRISEYVLEAQIGKGAFGEVWRAHHHVWTDQLVAVKIPTDSSYVKNLQHEGAAIHGLVHPNIVRAIGFDPYGAPPYLITEFVPGVSLRPLIQQRKLALPDALAVLRQVLTGLGYAHAQGVVHRDIKPENILIHERAFTDGFDTEGVVKVTDFGLGKAIASMMAEGSMRISTSLDGDDAKAIAGTLDYMPPEARDASRGTLDGRADLYACGVMLYEMLVGERPAGAEVPSERNPSLPRYLDEVFRHAYTRLEKRFATADEFKKALVPPAVATFVPPKVVPDTAVHGGDGTYVPSNQKACPVCKQTVATSDQFCMHCGVQLTPTVRRCPKCGAYPDLTDQYCMFCGEMLSPAAIKP